MLFKKIDDSSVNAITSALNVFTTPSTNVAVSSAQFRELLTLNPIE